MLVKKQVECSIKKLRSDGGGEYISNEFDQFYKNEGIKHEIVAPYTPWHNDVGERKNMSILNMERRMLKARQILNNFGGEATSIEVHIINGCSAKKLMNKI